MVTTNTDVQLRTKWTKIHLRSQLGFLVYIKGYISSSYQAEFEHGRLMADTVR